MEGRELLDAHVFNRRQEIERLLQTLFFRGFFRLLFLFAIAYILGVKKHTLFNKHLSQKWQPIWQEERDVGYERRKEIIFCMLCSGHMLFINIIHWLDLNLGHCSCNLVDI